MASQDWSQAHHLIREMRDHPEESGFFALIRRLDALSPDSPRMGDASRPSQEAVRFGQHVSMAFQLSQMQNILEDRGGRAPRIMVNFFGLLGSQGPLPLDVTEYIREREHNVGDPTVARFLDMFHHRLIAMFYRAWALNEQACSYDRLDDDWFGDIVASVAGYGMHTLRDRDAVNDQAKMFYSGRLAAPVRNAEGLRVILADYLGMEVTVNEFDPHWASLPAHERTKLGDDPVTGTLGAGVVVGERIWDVQQRYRLSMGPLTLHDFEALLPETRMFTELKDWVKNYIGDMLECVVELRLKYDQIPQIKMGQYGALGRTTWLGGTTEQEGQDGVVRLCINPLYST